MILLSLINTVRLDKEYVLWNQFPLIILYFSSVNNPDS